MGSVNKVTLIGALGRDPEIRTLNSGDRVANLRIATSENWKDKATGERKERTEWHSVVVFNEHLVKLAENHLRKGSQVYLEGTLQTRKWTDQSGADKYTTEVVLQKFNGTLTMLGGAPRSDADDGESFRGGGSRSVADSPAPDFAADSEIPF